MLTQMQNFSDEAEQILMTIVDRETAIYEALGEEITDELIKNVEREFAERLAKLVAEAFQDG